MRIGRILLADEPQIALFFDDAVVPIRRAWPRGQGQGEPDILAYLPPHGVQHAAAEQAWSELSHDADRRAALCAAEWRPATPIERPAKTFFLAGNYAAHIVEQGGVAAEREQTFPYVFLKPPSTTLIPDGGEAALPAVSPEGVDHEVELAVVIGSPAKSIAEQDALSIVAGYTIVNDLSNRRFRPNPDRRQRERDKFFDWLHGKWFDGFCPCGPCIATPSEIPDPQRVSLGLRVNGESRQAGSTADQVFPVAAVIAFISQMVTLEPGDLIATGTPAGVGAPHERFLQAGDLVEAYIDGIGTLRTHIAAPADVPMPPTA